MKRILIDEKQHPITHPPLSQGTSIAFASLLPEPHRKLLLRELERLYTLQLEAGILRIARSNDLASLDRCLNAIELTIAGRLHSLGNHGTGDPPMNSTNSVTADRHTEQWPCK